jgi:hypothetical protein
MAAGNEPAIPSYLVYGNTVPGSISVDIY